MNAAKRPVRKAGRAPRSAGASAGPGWLARPHLWCALLALALYVPAFGYGFVRDDHALIERNAFLHGGAGLGRLLTTDYWESAGGASGLWRPIVTLSLWLEGRVAGWTPGHFHAVNALAHAATTGALTAVVTATGAPVVAAWAAGLWFATMPAHVESVAWISGRTDVLCALGFLVALWADERARRAGRRWPGWLALGALAFALGSKEAAAPFAAVAALAAWRGWRGSPGAPRRVIVWVLPYVVLTAVYLALHARFTIAPETPAYLGAADIARRRLAAWVMLPRYVAFLWPAFPHAPDLMLPLPSGPADPMVIAGALLQLATVAGLVVLAWRGAAAAAPLALFWTPLLPATVMALATGYLAHAERLLYLSSAGAAWLAGLGVAALARRGSVPRAAGAVALAFLVLAGAFVSLRILPAWRNDGTMYAALAAAQPDNPKAAVGMAETLAAAGRLDEAQRWLDRAERLDDRLPEAYTSEAGLAMRRGDWTGVLASARRALALDPVRREAELLEVTALLRLGRTDEARARLDSIRARRPNDPAFENLEGQALVAAGRDAEAIPLLEQASRWIGDDAALWASLGTARQKLGRFAGARDAYARALALAPRAYELWLRSAVVAQALGDAAGRDRALARAAALPQAADGRVEQLRRMLSAAPR